METLVIEKIASDELQKYRAFRIASIITSYPDENFQDILDEYKDLDKLASFCKTISNEKWEEIEVSLNKLSSKEIELDDLRSEYIDIFDRGRTENSLYETEYGRERAMVKTNELADLSGFYLAFGLDNDSENVIPEMADHVSVELEFYAFLLLKQIYLDEHKIEEGSEIVYEARKNFMRDHLGRFASSIKNRPGVMESDFYLPVFKWISDLVDNECNLLGVKPEKIDWIYGQSEPETIECAVTSCKINNI